MRTLKVYGYNNGEDVTDEDVPSATIEVSDDGTEIVSVGTEDAEHQETAEEILQNYIEAGLTAVEAVKQFAGSYGIVLEDGATESEGNEEVGSAEVEVEDAASEEDETVTSAVEEEPTGSASPQADRITSGAPMALVDDGGVVVTLFHSDENGDFHIRLDGNWAPLVDPRTIDGLTFVGVEEEALALYDEHQQNGNLVPIKFYGIAAEGPYWSETVVTENGEEVDSEEEVDEEAVTAALTLDGPLDLDNAISAALLNKDLRWWVSRRVEALGIEATLPWEDQ